ncbi:hypothetical protein IVG45_21440 [Methylomonas sp. LL1]|uniref:M35 family metallo-endopeptidase n=1 Tax=Methylomonas sp. LL1 TaxID=2785785 RepID=UPI0018C37E3C|nr:M35 family metallo-endopeptidase [Methylomonas sp. LL1]QPK63332.1 hypothetical protein IVG45_21440 [Methylomonas sp. LL1]CAG1022674.1 hypothetical protein MTYM_01899 [Methylococcales bacterium]
MDIFTDVYKALISVLQTKSLDSSWSTIEAELKALCANSGPSEAKSDSLAKARKKIEDAAGILDIFNTGKPHAGEILKAAQSATVGFQKRAAMLKTFKHFYFVMKKGNQSIWVVDHPKAYTQWAFDQLDGKTEKEVRAQLEQEEETFGASRRKMMSDALQLARKWSMDVVVKLGNADANTLAIVKRWFHADAATEQEVKATAAVLLAGYKKIENACNSTSIIFSDRPHKRADKGWNDTTFASVRSDDSMPVIYIFHAFLNAGKRTFFGNIPKLWLCALTVVHELSHKMVNTEDKRYDYDGLKPGRSISAADALVNADSWAYFGADLVGVLSQGTINDVLK